MGRPLPDTGRMPPRMRRAFPPGLTVGTAAVCGLVGLLLAANLVAAIFALELHWPTNAEEWSAWLSLGVAYGTLWLAVATIAVSVRASRDVRERQQRERAVEFLRVASMIKNATSEMAGFIQQGDMLRFWMEVRGYGSGLDTKQARKPCWDRWESEWRNHRGDYFAYLELVGAGFPRELLNRLPVHGMPAVDVARNLDDDPRTIAALTMVREIIEETMAAVAKKHGLRTALLELREGKDSRLRGERRPDAS